MIFECIPYDLEKNIGKSYNYYCSLAPEGSWILFRDGDTMWLCPDWIHHLEECIRKYPDTGLFTCMTNRVGDKRQCHQGDISNVDSIVYHKVVQNNLLKRGIHVEPFTPPFSGMMMLFKKSVWDACKFDESGILKVDNQFTKKVGEKGYPVRIIRSLYLLHYYRLLEGRLYKEHLKPKPKKVIDEPQANTVYTALIGDYDSPKIPAVTPKWNYKMFTNTSRKSDHWKVILKNYVMIDKRASILMARKIKLLPANYIPNSPFWLWTDASLDIQCNLQEFYDKHCKGYDITFVSHPHRHCIYQEAEACIKLQKDVKSIIDKQMSRYQNEGMPRMRGMYSTGLMGRHNNKAVNTFCDIWFRELSGNSIRDQLSVTYALWRCEKMGIRLKINVIPYETMTTRGQFVLHKHNIKVKL